MNESAFRNWLASKRRAVDGAGLDVRTIGSRISNCRTVERFEGDLDHQFDQDQLQGLLDRLRYSTRDAREHLAPRHHIPIHGNIHNGTATLRSAVSLYKQFRENSLEGFSVNPLNKERSLSADRPGITAPLPRAIKVVSPAKLVEDSRTWPVWQQPSAQQILELAQATVPLVRFLDPDVVRAIVEDNEHYRASWIEVLKSRGIDSSAYLWDGSPCAFPGVRRYAGSREIAAHRGHTSHSDSQNLNALALDDNDYPKQVWSFILRGVQFSKFGPDGYALAHLADHKDHNNRSAQDFDLSEESDGRRSLYGLYTCPSNTVYIPVTLIKPTDFVGTLRALLVRRAQQLYGSFCKILPPFLRIPETYSPEWDIQNFKWAEPVGTTKHIP